LGEVRPAAEVGLDGPGYEFGCVQVSLLHVIGLHEERSEVVDVVD